MTKPLQEGRTLLHCLKDGQEHLVRPLMGLGLEANVTDAHGNTPLHAAAAGGHVFVLRVLVMNSAEPAALNSAGHNAQHCALMSSMNTLVRFRKDVRIAAMLILHVVNW
jgi:ankyrin repeat protein